MDKCIILLDVWVVEKQQLLKIYLIILINIKNMFLYILIQPHIIKFRKFFNKVELGALMVILKSNNKLMLEFICLQ